MQQNEMLAFKRGNVEYKIDPKFSYYFPHKDILFQRPVYRWDLTYGIRSLSNAIVNLAGTYELILLEIGSYSGESTVEFAKIFKKVIAVDPWKSGYDELDASSQQNMNKVKENYNFITRNFNNICTYQKTSKEFFHENFLQRDFLFPDIDIVYIDGLHTHEGVLQDISLWYPHCRFIAGHDLSLDFPGVEQAIRKYSNQIGIDFKVRIYSDTSWLIDKNEQEI